MRHQQATYQPSWQGSPLPWAGHTEGYQKGPFVAVYRFTSACRWNVVVLLIADTDTHASDSTRTVARMEVWRLCVEVLRRYAAAKSLLPPRDESIATRKMEQQEAFDTLQVPTTLLLLSTKDVGERVPKQLPGRARRRVRSSDASLCTGGCRSRGRSRRGRRHNWRPPT